MPLFDFLRRTVEEAKPEEKPVQISSGGEKIALDTLTTQISNNRIHELKIYNEYDDSRIKLIIPAIAERSLLYSSLTHLELVECSFEDVGAINIAKELPSCSSLTTLIIEANYRNEGTKALVEAVAAMPAITTFMQYAPFSDIGMEAIISLIEGNPNITAVGASDATIGLQTFQHLFQVLQYDCSISHFAFPRPYKSVPFEWLCKCFMTNSTLVSTHGSATAFMNSFDEFKRWFTSLNEICSDMAAGTILRNSVPYQLVKEKDIRAYLSKMAKRIKDITGIQTAESLLETQRQEIVRLHNKNAKLIETRNEEVGEKLFLKDLSRLQAEHENQTEIDTKKKLSEDLMGEAFKMLEDGKPVEAKCFLKIATQLDQFEDFDLGIELSAQIEEQLKLTEIERHNQTEARIAATKEDIAHAEQRAIQVRSEEERAMINEQISVLQEQVKKLEIRCQAFEKQQKEFQEREAQIEKQETLLKEQAKHLGELLSELTTANDVEPLVQQMSVVNLGDKDVDAARQRFTSLHKAAREAQQRLREEEKRQRERVEWLQKQIELYQLKGMSPAQLSLRNYLKDVKRLSVVRHHIDHTPYPLHCFISYAWELDAGANKALQLRLQHLKDDLEMAGMKVMLDVRDMKDDMRQFMVQNIQKSHKLLLICTPRLKDRAAEVGENNLKLELETALIRAKNIPEFIVPLIFSGSFGDAVPPQVQHLLGIRLTSKDEHYDSMASLAPMGLVPMLLGLERNKDYKRIHDRLFGELEDYAK